MVKAYVRWSVFCAATKRKMRMNQDWSRFYEVAKLDIPYLEKLDRYAAIAEEQFDTARFESFCQKHLAHLDQVAWDFFGTDEARDAVRQKVTALFPAHEVDRFTELFWGRIQEWRATEKPGVRSS
jgi:hypothetical protein